MKELLTEWRKYLKGELSDMPPKPEDIPANPDRVYRHKGWKNWGDWFGTGVIATFNVKYRPFKKARAFVRNLNLKNQAEWFEYTKSGALPVDIPATPNQVYKDKCWAGMGDWLGT